MSPGCLLLPFSELVLSSLSQLFTAAEGTAQEFAHWFLGMSALVPAPPASFCPVHSLPACVVVLQTWAMLWTPVKQEVEYTQGGVVIFPSWSSLLPPILMSSFCAHGQHPGLALLQPAEKTDLWDVPPCPTVWQKLVRSISNTWM